ncbi:MAG: tetratricopeptide repeat protein [Deltaproteobacteria bacterium]
MKRSGILSALGLTALAACASAPPKAEPPVESTQDAFAPTPSSPATAAERGPEPSARPRPGPVAIPPPSPRAEGAFEDALRHARAGDYPKAISLFRSVLGQAPEQAWAAYDLGLCYELTGQTESALAAYLQALAAKPDMVPAAENLTHLQLRRGEAAAAESTLRGLAAKNPQVVALHGLLAEALAAEGRYDDAADEAKKVLKTDERNVSAMLDLASIYYHQKRFELARMVTENARQIDGTNPLVYNTLAFLDLGDKNQALALEDLRKAADLREDLPEVQNNLGALLVAAQDYPGAIQHLQLAVHDAPAFADAHLNLGNAYRGNKQYDLARAEYEKALSLDPKQPDGWFDLGVLFLDGTLSGVSPLDRINQSIAYFQRFQSSGGADPKLDKYVQDAQKEIGKEKRREEVERRDKLRKASEEAKRAAAAKQRAAQLPAPSAGGGSKLGDPDTGPTPASYRPPASKAAPAPGSDGDKLGGDGK